MAVVEHGWVRVEREVRPGNGLVLQHVPIRYSPCLYLWSLLRGDEE